MCLILVGCGAVDDNPVTPDGNLPDAPEDEEPATTVRVAPAGDDGNDGLAAPVRTLKRALGIAAADSDIETIELATGRYSAASGETFPYAIADNLVLAGPAGGGAILEGTGGEPALTLDAGTLRDLELEQFAVAVTATGTIRLERVRIRTSTVAVRGETGGNIIAVALDVTGAPRACQTAIELNGTAKLSATMFTARELGTALDARGASTAQFGGLTIAGEPGCTAAPLFEITTSGAFGIVDGLVDGGNKGISFNAPAATPTPASLSNTIIRNLTGATANALLGRNVTFSMVGGELTNNARAGLEAFGGTWSFDQVTIKQNGVMGIYLQGSGAAAPGVLKLRNTAVTNNANGVYLFDFAQADLGTIAAPGNNTLAANTGHGVQVDGNSGDRIIEAVGNTWRASVQGSNAEGKYAAVALVAGPIDDANGQNFSINTGWSLRR